MVGKNLLLVGAGRIAHVHARSVRQLDDVRVTAVVDPDAKSGGSLANKLGARHFATLVDLDGTVDFDGVIIASPTGTHADLIETFAEREVPIFCEKPVDLSLARVDKCLERISRYRTPVLIGFHRRFDDARLRLKTLIDEGTVGVVEHVLQVSRDPRLPPEAYIAHSGGIVRDMLSHDLDEMGWLCGSGPVTVSANLRRTEEPEMLARQDDFDCAAITVAFENGPVCQLSAGRHSAYGFDQRLEVFGTKGLLRCENVRESVVSTADDHGFRSAPLLDGFALRYAEAYKAELTHFLEVIEGKCVPRCSVEDARRSLVLAELVLRAHEEGNSVYSEGL